MNGRRMHRQLLSETRLNTGSSVTGPKPSNRTADDTRGSVSDGFLIRTTSKTIRHANNIDIYSLEKSPHISVCYLKQYLSVGCVCSRITMLLHNSVFAYLLGII